MTAHLTADAAAPLTKSEIAQLGQLRQGDDECIMPVPGNPGPLPTVKENGPPDRRFEYRDAKGQLLGYVLRWEAREDRRKDFRPVTFWRGGKGKQGWRLKEWPEPRPLFGLDRLAQSPDAVVLLAEGEKSALAVQLGPLAEVFAWAKRPVIGVTWPGGSKAVEKGDFSPLADRDVIILPDADKDGEEAADKLVGILHDAGVRRLQRWKAPDSAPEKWDIADPVPDGFEPGTVVESIFAAPECSVPHTRTGIGQDSAGTMRQSAATPFAFDPKPYQFPDPAAIPPRQWLYGRHYMRGVVSGTLGAPGRLKSTTLLTELVGMTASLDLIGGKRLESGPLRAAYFNGEETQDELDRRVAAIMNRYRLEPKDCADRLWVVSTREAPIRLAVMGPKGTAVVAQDVVGAVTTWCEARAIDVFVVDPLVSFHQVRENDPGDMDLLYKEAFGRIAGKERRAVDLAIHPRKPAQGEINTSMSDLRGSGAQEAALRIARVFNFMTTAEATQLGIDEDDRRRYVRIEGGKGGPAPIAKATWIKIDVEPLPNGDDVAVAVAWKPENPFTKVVQGDLQVVQRAVQGGAFRTNSQSPDWLGWWMAENLPHLGIKTRFHDKPRTAAGKAEVARLTQIIATWRTNEGLDVEPREDKNRQPRDFFIVGRQSSEPAESHADDGCTTLIN